MIIRTIARWLLASWFIDEGIGSIAKPGVHIALAEPFVRKIADATDMPQPETKAMANVVRVHGSAMAGAGLLLGTGLAPRAAALLLAGLTAPIAVANAPLGRRVTPQEVDAPSDQLTTDARTSRFMTALAMTGAALLAAFDREGKPSLAWRLEDSRRRAARQSAT